MQKAYYVEKLYPFQDGIISMLKGLDTGFYLTGGTVLSRAFFHHRFSDDLDFFCHEEPDFQERVQRILDQVHFSGWCKVSEQVPFQLDSDFSRVFLERVPSFGVPMLKMDFVNDVGKHLGKIIEHPIFGPVDNLENLLVNKLTALGRYEPKDVADIWIIAKNSSFCWKERFAQAKQKDLGITPEETASILKGFPVTFFEKVQWQQPPNRETFFQELSRIASDMLKGEENHLALEKR